MRLAGLAVIAACWCTAWAAPLHAAPVEELAGARSQAMGGAHRGLGTSNDSVVLNPAGMALRPRYSIDASYGYSGDDAVSQVGASIVDSKSGPVAGALGYTYERGDHDFSDVELHRIYVATAYPILENLALGLTSRHVRGTFDDEAGHRQQVESFSWDLGASALLFDFLGVGVVWHNLYTTSRKRLSPPHLGLGLAYVGAALAVAADVEVDLRPRRLGDPTLRVGAEYLIAELVPVRLGYTLLPRTEEGLPGSFESRLSAGVGVKSEHFGAEAAYTQSVDRLDNWDLMAALKVFL